MITEKDYWTSKKIDGKWAVNHSGAKKASSLFNTQELAWKEARRFARAAGTKAYLKGKDGKIQAQNRYGNDPYPPKK